MGGLLRGLLRLLGLAGPDRRNQQQAAEAARQAAILAATPKAPPPSSLTPMQFREARRRVVAYVSASRVPLRQVVAARQAWLVDLGKVYASIASSPTEMVLQQAGSVGENFEPAFREALQSIQSFEPPLEAEDVHASLVKWVTALHSACLALIDARKFKDRAMLGQLREQLGQARQHAATLVTARAELFVEYKLNVQPGVQRRRPARPRAEPAAESVDSRQSRGTRPPHPRSGRRPAEKRGPRVPRDPARAPRRAPMPVAVRRPIR